MNNINLLIAETNEKLLDKKASILDAIKKAKEYAFPKLKIDWDIDVLIRSSKQNFPNAKDHVRGHTYESNLIRLLAADGFNEFEISEVLVHELCHAARWGKNDEWMNTLYDALIFEGLAVCFTEEFSKNSTRKQVYMKTIINRSDKENEEILNILKKNLLDANYDYKYIFTGNGNNLPYWAGYSLGYYLVKKYLAKTGGTIEEAFASKYADIEYVLNLESKKITAKK